MANTIFEEMGGTYTKTGDYILPNLTLPPEEKKAYRCMGTAAQTLSEAKS